MDSTSISDVLNDSCEDLFLTQNSFNPPANGEINTQRAGEATDYLFTFDSDCEQNSKESEDVVYMDFTYQIDNGSTVLTPENDLKTCVDKSSEIPCPMIERMTLVDGDSTVSFT